MTAHRGQDAADEAQCKIYISNVNYAHCAQGGGFMLKVRPSMESALQREEFELCCLHIINWTLGCNEATH